MRNASVDRAPIITTDLELAEKVAGTVASLADKGLATVHLDSARSAIDYMQIEMPEIVFLNFSDPGIEASEILAVIAADPWLLHGGIIAFCDDHKAVERLETAEAANVLVTITRDHVDADLHRVMTIIRNNRRILFQREIGSDLVCNIEGHFELRNDPLEVGCYTNLICSFLCNSNLLSLDKKHDLRLALDEMLMNAIEHGNCGITFDEKTRWLEKRGRHMSDLIAERCEDPEVAEKRVTFEYRITRSSSQFVITDEGAGFDWRSVKDVTRDDAILSCHGRGILMARAVTKDLTYSEKGNEVRFEIDHQRDECSLMPGLLADLEAREVKKGEVIFEQDHYGDFFYYIAKGRYHVVVNDKIVGTLSADDIFVGEMALLLGNRRRATVRAATAGRLIEISKRDLVATIQRKPHYALLLARLLAQRIERLLEYYTVNDYPSAARSEPE